MSLVQPPVPDRRPSPNLELATNNPFRARLSGVPLSPSSTTSERFSFAPSGRERPVSKNPFLDVFDDDNEVDSTFDPQKSHKANSFAASSAQRPQFSGAAADLFENLTITDHSESDRSKVNRMKPPARPQQPPNFKSRPPPAASHHHSKSSDNGAPLISLEDDDVPRPRPKSRLPPPRRPSETDRLREFDREPRRRPRRNSESSVMDAHEAEQKDKEKRERRRDRDQRTRDEKATGGKDARRGKKITPLDVIDKLDVTGFGVGSFHHDGPFDACNPHRNKNPKKLAPMQAFPADSANNALTGFGPLNSKADHSHVYGNRDPEAFHDFTMHARRGSGATDALSRPPGTRVQPFDPKIAAEMVHGDESLGLGTSTFLDGAPASKAAVERYTAENPDDRPKSSGGGGGLQRKKSLAQKIRSISQNRTAYSDEPISSRRRPPPPGRRSPSESRNSPTTPMKTNNERNPFFSDYDSAYDQKGESISIAKNEKRRDRTPSLPMKQQPGISRTATADRSGAGEGLLKRVRSLSKPKRRND
ncbi:hypothetical protein RUND412_006982 [Rhizina undulata]